LVGLSFTNEQEAAKLLDLIKTPIKVASTNSLSAATSKVENSVDTLPLPSKPNYIAPAPAKRDSIVPAPAKRDSIVPAPAKRDSIVPAPAKRDSIISINPAKSDSKDTTKRDSVQGGIFSSFGKSKKKQIEKSMISAPKDFVYHACNLDI
jgi:hypothetical protein